MQFTKMRFDPLPVFIFLLFLLAIVVIGGFALYEANQLTNLTEKLYRHPLTVSNALRDIQISIYTIDRSMRDAILAENSKQFDKDIAKMDAFEKEAFAYFDLVEERFLGDKKYVRSVRRDFENWRAIRREVIALVKQDRQKEATAITRGENVAQIDLINKGADGKAGLNYLLNFSNNKATEFQEKAKRKENVAILRLFFILVITFLLCIITVVLLRRSIKVTTALNESEERHRLLVESASDGIISFDDHGRIVSWNNAARTIFGYSAAEAIGKSTDFLTPDRLRKENKEAFTEIVSRAKLGTIQKAMEISALRKNGNEFTAEVSSSCWEREKRTFCNMIVRDISDRKKAEEALRRAHDELDQKVKERTAELTKANEQLQKEIIVRRQVEEDLRKSEKQLKALSSKLLEVQEHEKKLVAQELHDSVGQALTSLKFTVESVLKELTGKIEESHLRSLNNLIMKIQETVKEANRIGRGLRPSMLDDLGILTTLSWFCREFQDVYSGIQIKRDIDIEEDDVSENLKVVIYRVLQESLNNVAKHSRADFVNISLKKINNTIELSIKDNGKGFDLDYTLSHGIGETGLGLSGIMKRIELSGGSCEMITARRMGTKIKAVWPC